MTQQQQNNQQVPQQPGTTNTFSGGMVKDPLDLFKKSDSYTHARNATNILPDGQIGGKNSEPSNIASANIPYTPIGFIYLSDDQWIVFSTNNTVSEIGLFIDSANSYTTLINDAATIAASLPGLNFNTNNLITGASRRGYDCGFDVYWSDGRRNPDRMLNTATCPYNTADNQLTPNPWFQDCVTSAGCTTCTNTNKIDIQQLRLAPIFGTPCLRLSKGTGGGQLPNGSYQVCIAFTVNSIKCTDYVAFSNVFSTWTHLNNGGSINLTIEGMDKNTRLRFTEMEVVVISMVNQQVQAKKLGIYSTNISVINIDNIDQTLVNIPIERLPLSSPAIVSSDAIYSISNYLTRLGVIERPNFNYQPLANKIQAKWAAVQYPEDYYHKGGDQYGMNVGYLRGEVYAFYIRWVYNTGDKSASYVIPGLPAGTLPQIVSPSTYPLVSSGTVIAAGTFEGWESTEMYPDNQLNVWGALCGQNIRWHKFPDQASFNTNLLSHFNPLGPQPAGKGYISVMGVYFENIPAPVDNNGNYIPDIVGYEILRAVRDGHQSIVAKGMVNNMREYKDNSGQSGLFQNYPYNDLRQDPYLSNSVSTINTGVAGNGLSTGNMLLGYSKNIISFHSPDTVFRHPYIGTGSLDLVQEIKGNSTGTFTQPWHHPQFKVLTNFDSIIGDVITAIEIFLAAVNVIAIAGGGNSPALQLNATQDLPISLPLFIPAPNQNIASTTNTPLNIAVAAVNVALFAAFIPIQAVAFRQQILDIIKGVIPPRQYALQYNSWGFYNTPGPLRNRLSFSVNDYQYIKDQVQSFSGQTINNLYRNDYVAISLNLGGQVFPALTGDNSRYLFYGDPNGAPNSNLNNQDASHTIDSYYASYRISQLSQYGQIDSTKQVPIDCVQKVQVSQNYIVDQSEVMFGGDTYINRYTEKNPFFFFNDWLIDVPEDFKYDYRNYMNVPYPMFWLDNSNAINYSLLGLASDSRRLNGPLNSAASLTASFPYVNIDLAALFYVKTGYFYLFNNGIRDFFVESSVNVGYRDWEDMTAKRFYDPYASSNEFVNQMFRSDIIKSNILYKYDYSLSANRFINQYISWSQCLRRDYNPDLAYTCYAYYPRRIHYSLPQEEEKLQDNWRIFLPNNYKDFNDKVTVIKDLHKTGAVFLMESSAPMMFAGTETIPSKSNTEYTVGTGLLFHQTLQSVTNVDDSYEYASCQSKLGVINTPHGVFWVSQNTGKIFNIKNGQLTDLGELGGLKYHLLKYLPSQLLQQFPTYPLYDNPVAGVGMQIIYDSINDFLYFCKKDYRAKDGVRWEGGQWIAGGTCPPGYAPISTPKGCGCKNMSIPSIIVPCNFSVIKINLGDPTYFEDCSWTLSYDCKINQFVSWHDWHPSLHVPSKNHFLTTNDLSGGLWRHNNTVQSFCNFYGKDYPFEIEYYTNTQITESVLQSVEWLLESYQYAPNGVDKFLNYDESFNQIMVYNREQNSSLQNMFLKPWNDPYIALTYPNFSGPTRQILYQKVENKYRVNDFYDFTKDRGQFTLTNTPMITTDNNGYTFTTNTAYFDLNKPWNQLKKFRYTGSRIFMRKTNLKNNSVTLRFADTKQQYSPR